MKLKTLAKVLVRLEKMPKKTPNQASGYYAVRRGKNIKNCIFLEWDDCKAFVEDDTVAEYHVFDALEEAAAYLMETEAPLPPDVHVPEPAIQTDTPSVPAESQANTVNSPLVEQNDVQLLTSVVHANVPPSKKRPLDHDIQEVKGRSYRPTKKWEEMFCMLEESLRKGTGEHLEDGKLKQWMKDQSYKYKLFQENKPSSMNEEKVQRLLAIGFDFQSANIQPVASQDPGISPASKNPPRIQKRWQESCDKLKAYMEAHNGSWEIDPEDHENARLREWIKDQQLEYRKWSEGQDALMTDEKVKELETIGFQFAHVKWDDRIEQLKEYKKQNGDFAGVFDKDTELGKWVRLVRRQCKTFLETNKPTRDLNAQRLEQLQAIGFDPTQRPVKLEKVDDADWESKFVELQEYKKVHLSCNVTRSDEHLELFNWINQQRNEYRKLRKEKPSKLTAGRILRLNELGFEFSQRGSYQNFNDRIEQMKQFKAQHGHVNIPTSHPELGEFVSRQRWDYRRRQDGFPSPMTDERCKILTDLGFKFDLGLRWDRSKMLPPKSWDERFQELLNFKQTFGHCIVPQHSQHIPGLGSWVKEQRKNYKLMMEGRRSSMTPEKALKLSNVGFVFNVLEHSKKRKSAELDEGEAMKV